MANSLRTKWDNYYKVYKGHRVKIDYDGVAEATIRESHTIVETLVANIAGGDIKFHFVPTSEEQAKDTDVLNSSMEYWLNRSKMDLVAQEWVREMVLYGTGIVGVTYEKGMPRVYNIPLRDFFIDPTAVTLHGNESPVASARYAGSEYLADADELRRKTIYDPEKDKFVPRYKNLELIGYDTSGKDSGSDSNVSMDKAFKDMFEGSTLEDKAVEHQVHVIELHHLPTGKIYEVGNRKKFISIRPTWCQREEVAEKRMIEVDGALVEAELKLKAIEPFLPFAALRCYTTSSQFYASGEMELLLDDNELLNDYESMTIDNNAYQNTPMYTIDPAYSDLVDDIETVSGAVYPIPKGALAPIERPQLTTDLDNKQVRVMERMRRATAADEAVQGGSVGSSRTTATEVSTSMQQAMMRFSTKIKNLESEGFATLASIMLKVSQIFTTRETARRIVGKEGIYFKDYDPFEYDGEFEVIAKLDSTIKREKMEVGQKDNQIYQILSEDPQGVFNPVEVKRWMMQKIDPNLTDEDFNKLLAPPKQPQDDVKDVAVMQYKDATPHTKAQMEARAGYIPDPIHEVEARIQLQELASRGVDIMNPATDTNNNPLPGAEQAMASMLPQPPTETQASGATQ